MIERGYDLALVPSFIVWVRAPFAADRDVFAGISQQPALYQTSGSVMSKRTTTTRHQLVGRRPNSVVSL